MAKMLIASVHSVSLDPNCKNRYVGKEKGSKGVEEGEGRVRDMIKVG